MRSRWIWGLCSALVIAAATPARSEPPPRGAAKARAATPTVARMVFDNIDYYEDITITFTPDATGGGVTVRWQERKTIVEKHFAAEVRAELAKLWGSDAFAISVYPGDRSCLGVERRWELSRGADRRTICHNQKAMLRLAEVQSALQLIMRD